MEPRSVPVRSIEAVGPGAVSLVLETPEDFDARPGQFVLVRGTVDGEEHARHYTISSPSVADTFELTVGVDPDGAFSGWVTDHRVGDELVIEGPFGRVYYDDEGSVRVIAGGPGIGAGLGVAERAVAVGHDAAVVAVPPAGGLIHPRRFAALAAAGHPVYVATTDAGLHAAVASVRTAVPEGTTFVFGFRTFVDRACEAIAAGGGDPDAAMIESYG